MGRLQELQSEFIRRFGGSSEGIRYFHAPGRVNLIGEHTDYNGGYVFPAALSFGTTLVIRRRNDHILNLASTNIPLQINVSVDSMIFREEDGWTNYPKGVAYFLQQDGLSLSGYDMMYHGEIPNGSGLSSSASMEVVTGFGLMTMEGADVDKVKLALLAQRAENRFVQVNCGIMDQFAVSMGKKGQAMLLKCDTMNYKHVPFQNPNYKIVIGNTHKKRGLVDSEYNLRRSQCEQAVKDLHSEFPQIKFLGELTLEQFNQYASLIADPTVRKRARHVIEENDRVLQSMKVLSDNRVEAFGELMTASHVSLRDLYEVTCKELDVMVEAALKIPGVLGSRMTGAGFGGCTVSLVHHEHVEEFVQKVGTEYAERTGITADFYICEIGDGVKELEEDN